MFLVDNCLNATPEMLEWLMGSESGKRLIDGVIKNAETVNDIDFLSVKGSRT